MSERGQGRLGCLLSGTVLAAALFVSFKAAPVYLDKIEFEADLDKLTRRAAVDHWDDRVITGQVLEAARSRSFELTFNDIGIRRSSRFAANPSLRVTVHFVRTVPFPGYIHVFDFESSIDSMTASF